MSSKVLLMQELRVLIAQINVQIKALETLAVEEQGLKDVYHLRYSDGTFAMPPLLEAKTKALYGIAILQSRRA